MMLTRRRLLDAGVSRASWGAHTLPGGWSTLTATGNHARFPLAANMVATLASAEARVILGIGRSAGDAARKEAASIVGWVMTRDEWGP